MKAADLLVHVQALQETETEIASFLVEQQAKLSEVSTALKQAQDALATAGADDPGIQDVADKIDAIVADMKSKFPAPVAPVSEEQAPV